MKIKTIMLIEILALIASAIAFRMKLVITRYLVYTKLLFNTKLILVDSFKYF